MSHRITSRARFRSLAGPLAALALVLSGCASTGVTSRAVESIAGGLADADLYHQDKVSGDEAMRANLRDAWTGLGRIEAELAIERATVDGKLAKQAALDVARTLADDLSAAGAKLEDIAKAQAAAEVHYQGLRGTLRATVGLVRALADREVAEQEAQARTIEAGAAAVDAAKRLGVAGATGGAVR